MTRKNRDSNYELLRIVATFLIILWHTIRHANLIENTGGVLNFVIIFFVFLTIIHVSLYMLIMGYYQSKGTFKLKKFLSLIIEIWFYNFIINLILALTGLVQYTNIEFLRQTFILNYSCYWFMTCYLIVYLFSPFINKLIDTCNKVELKRIIILCLICFSFAPYFTGNLSFGIDGGSVYQFITLYFIGAYIRKYDINKNLLKNFNIHQKRLIYLILFLMLLIMNFSIYYLRIYMDTLDSNILKYISGNIQFYFYEYNNPFVILESILIFLLFGTFDIKSKFINIVSSLTLGIYLIHESCYMQSIIYRPLGINADETIFSKSFILKIIVFSVIVFIICGILEYIRQLLFKFILKNRQIKKVSNKLYNYIANIIEIKQ